MNLSVSENNDLEIANNQLVLVEGADEITQLVIQRLKTFYGEWFLDTSRGVPYFEQILEKNPNPSTIEAIFTKIIIETDGVLELTSIKIDLDNASRYLTVDVEMRIESDPGLIHFSTTVGG